ncbi:MAG: helix-turn-helix domain-containing protein [Saprospiraceae bacterium]|nr:helix-turn-helix domain-containing protein [Saprospiraceae bacterium]
MLAENLKYLRKVKRLSQQQLADQLQMPRSTLGDYERSHTEPSINMLLQIASFFEVTLDELLTSKLSHRDLEIIRTGDLRVLAITVDKEDRENIELVESKAAAGYLTSFADPEYIKELPKLYFPNIPQGTYRAFEIQGDSMLPLTPGSIVICSYVERIEDLQNERTYVIATHLDGIVYKRVLLNPDRQSITALSDNPAYPPFRIPYGDLAEIWEYYAHLSFTDVKSSVAHAFEEKINDIQEKVTYIRQRMTA